MTSETDTAQRLTKGKATICVVNYKTPELIKLCLRSIRAFTQYPHEVVVIDNNCPDHPRWIRVVH